MTTDVRPVTLKGSVCGRRARSLHRPGAGQAHPLPPQRAATAGLLAITLETLEDAEWTTVRLWDNADDVDEHHEHAYTREGGKQPPTILDFKSSNDAMAAAIRKAKAEAPEIVRRWREEQ